MITTSEINEWNYVWVRKSINELFWSVLYRSEGSYDGTGTVGLANVGRMCTPNSVLFISVSSFHNQLKVGCLQSKYNDLKPLYFLLIYFGSNI